MHLSLNAAYIYPYDRLSVMSRNDVMKQKDHQMLGWSYKANVEHLADQDWLLHESPSHQLPSQPLPHPPT